ncbi:putative dehydrogenase [Catenibacillus scindens]|uniref:Putative dehydrogenase n=1 Tax=Catenibacillus scindens TaxID=673271 RepID=A0A7W8M6I9_9FIRM|nr:Gfo/Idh/MocA family oxidoreductase [Catenibacillus scindens]MBB5266034.1 putative dehydrogenase [Catenibacillus scindens]
MAKKDYIGIGIIGCGTISDVYLTNITQHYHNVKVIACADMFLEKAEAAKEKFNLPKACTVDELLANPEVELVVNLTIPAAHYEINMKALNAGKNVYCEKPLALNLEDAEATVKLAKEKGLIACSAPDTFLGAGVQTCRKMIDEGKIGRPVGFTANLVCPGHELWHDAPEFYYKQGGGPMWDMGPYYITALVSLLGPVKRVSCMAKISRAERDIHGTPMKVEVPTHYAGLMEFENGVIGNVNMSFDVWDSQLPCMEIYGTTGMLTVPDPNLFGGTVNYFDGNKLTDIVKAVEGPAFARLVTMVTKTPECREEAPLAYPADEDPRCNMRGLGVSDIAQSLIEGRESRLSGELSRHVVEILAAFDKAAKEGVTVEMTTTCQRPAPMAEGLALWQVD